MPKMDKGIDLSLAYERFKTASDAESDTREKSLDDFQFRIGEQWPTEIKKVREAQNLPCLTINRVPRTIAQVTNEQRQQRPAGQINPVGSGADKETADVMQGLIRHIEVQSDADIAKDIAFDHMVTGGLGWLRVVTDYVDNDSDEQEIYIQPIENAFSVYSDPYESLTHPADYRFIVVDVKPEEYKRMFPKSDLAKVSIQEWGTLGNSEPGWVTEGNARIAEYFFIEETEGKNKPIRKCIWCKINGVEVLEGPTEWLVDEIPVFPVKGEELTVDGKKHLAGLVRYAKDPARMYNVWVSAATTMIGMAPKPKYVAAAGQVEKYISQWERANRSDIGVLTYDPIDVNGELVERPTLESYEPPVQAIQLMVHQADNDFKATTGIYDASLGQKGPDESGKAILARQKQTDIAILNFSDNLSRTLLRLYRHLLKLIPKVYSERTILRIIKPDGTSEMVHVNDAKVDVAAGIKKVFDIRSGRYDVVVTVGPSYQTKRQESVQTQLELAKSFPVVGQAAPDLVIRNMDIPQADEIADRVKLLLPPQILQAEDQNQVPQLHAQLAHATQQVQLLSKVNNELLEAHKSKQLEMQAKVQQTAMQERTKVTIAQMDNVAKVAVAEVTTKSQDARQRAQGELEILGHAHELGLQKDQQAHEKQMAAIGHAQAMEQGQQDTQNQAALAEQGQQHALEQGEQSGQQASDLAAQNAAQNQEQAQ